MHDVKSSFFRVERPSSVAGEPVPDDSGFCSMAASAKPTPTDGRKASIVDDRNDRQQKRPVVGPGVERHARL
jgi:hypothetical protein